MKNFLLQTVLAFVLLYVFFVCYSAIGLSKEPLHHHAVSKRLIKVSIVNTNSSVIPALHSTKVAVNSSNEYFKFSPLCLKILNSVRAEAAMWNAARRELNQSEFLELATSPFLTRKSRLVASGRRLRDSPVVSSVISRAQLSSHAGITAGKLNSQFKSNISVLHDFYSVKFGATVVVLNNTAMPYVTLWKCANDAIRLNLLAEVSRRQNPTGGPLKSKEYEVRSTANYRSKLIRMFHSDILPPAFTFVRDPISHFVSGFSEFYWRGFHNDTADPTRLRGELAAFFDFTDFNTKHSLRASDSSQVYEVKHFSAMSGILKQNFNIKLLGKLESFSTDWDRIGRFYGTTIPFDKSLGVHPTSKDPNGVRKAFEQLFQEDVRYKRAMCQLLLVDFECFNYSLPPECADLPKLFTDEHFFDVVASEASVRAARRRQPRNRTRTPVAHPSRPPGRVVDRHRRPRQSLTRPQSAS